MDLRCGTCPAEGYLARAVKAETELERLRAVVVAARAVTSAEPTAGALDELRKALAELTLSPST